MIELLRRIIEQLVIAWLTKQLGSAHKRLDKLIKKIEKYTDELEERRKKYKTRYHR